MIRKALLMSFLSLLFFVTFSQDVQFLIQQAEQLEYQKKDNEALTKYQEAVRLSPNELKALCKISELNSILGTRSSDKQRKTEHFTAARMYAERAIKTAPHNPQANFVMALAKAKLTEISSPKEKIQFVKEIKIYADKALTEDSLHFPSLHLLGKWHVEVSGLNGMEKAAVKMFGGLPPADLKEAISLFEKVKKIKPVFVLNYLDLAKAYKQSGRSDKAIEVLSKMVKLPPRASDDETYKTEGKKLLESLL